MGEVSVTDEAFLKAIREAPGDVTPRLVYADWLDESGKPGGDYLRAEVAWARRREPEVEAEACRRAGGLDPVWVARVSRPPLGVCCDRARFTDRGPELSDTDLDRLEGRLGTRLPTGFRAFLLEYNGGTPDPPCIPDPRHVPPAPVCLMIGQFYAVREGADAMGIEQELEFMHSIHENYPEGVPFLAEGMLPIADTLHDLGCLLVGVAPANFGRVFHFDNWARHMDDAQALAELAPSFADLLVRLTPDLED
jgi:uncharacterized protein (TIGR02996 family)